MNPCPVRDVNWILLLKSVTLIKSAFQYYNRMNPSENKTQAVQTFNSPLNLKGALGDFISRSYILSFCVK